MGEEKKSVKERIVEAAWELFYEKGYDNTTVDDIINLSDTSKGSFYYYFDGKDALLKTLSTILDEWYEELEGEMDSDMNCFEKLLYLNRNIHERMEQKINYELLASLYSTQMVTRGNRDLLDQNRTYYRLITKIVEEGQGLNQISQKKTVKEIVKYYSLCERALVSDWCLSKGEYSLSEYSKEYMPMMLESFRQS
ncbi:MAG: TetR/AcrR family transcriptional regulator [Lachnospiraceae bacterium]